MPINYFSSIRQPSPLQIDRAAFSANLILLLGYIFALWFQIYDFNKRAREAVAISVYFLGFALLVVSAIIELSVDIVSARTVGHGRYHSHSPVWNRIISLFFIAAMILDIVSFSYWILRKFDIEDIVLVCSAYILLIMATLAVFFQIKERIVDTPDTIEFFSNSMVFLNAILGVVLRHLELSEKDLDNLTNGMELSLVIVFLISTVLYILADLLRLKSGGGNVGVQS
jgi:hypothetical protein